MTVPQPFRTELENGVLSIFFDTPASSINVFSVAAAERLMEILRGPEVSDARAVVFRSGKPRSFVNGVGLMLANAVRTPEDAARLTEPVRAAYAMLRNLPVPTVAVVEGSCYGCGVELTLHCRHRIAVDLGDTEFYMTEIADYLFVPVFGATRDLPRLVGLGPATNLQLWGHRLNARAAADHGLVDACVSSTDRESAIRRFVERAILGEVERRTLPPEDFDAIATATHARIAALPASYRATYTECFELLERAARGLDDDETAAARERHACGRSAMTSVSKAAQGFFYVRQIANRLGHGGAELAAGTVVELVDVPVLARCFGSRVDSDLDVRIANSPSPAPEAPNHAPSIAFESARSTGSIVAKVRDDASDTNGDAKRVGVRLFAESGRPRFAEVVSNDDDGRKVYALLARVGLPAASTNAREQPASDALLDAFVEPIVSFLASDARPSVVAVTLREAGFVDLPRESLASRVRNASDAFAKTADPGRPDGALESAILVSLLSWATSSLEEGTIAHPSIADVIATDLLGFPVGLGGLCRHLSIARVRSLLAESRTWSGLVDANRARQAEEFVERGRPFYRG